MDYPRKKTSGGGNNKKYAKKSYGEASVMNKAICSKCDRECMVPFKPTGTKPVLCSNCFKKPEGSSKDFKGGKGAKSNRDFSKKSFDPRSEPRFEPRKEKSAMTSEQFEILNAKLDKILGKL